MANPRDDAETLVRQWYQRFNDADRAGMLALLAADVVHDINQGGREIGREAFEAFLARMDRCYQERIADLVVMTDATGAHAAAEFVVHGRYVAADEGLPPATGQAYTLPAGAFFALKDGRIGRISTCYDLAAWIRMVGG
ncbi:MAG: nuclear transport factor 2 family protein [Acetobacteraceae bacterium]|nr:nuclear transport factor 2 family protein [Acetobacteraceae bacterium]